MYRTHDADTFIPCERHTADRKTTPTQKDRTMTTTKYTVIETTIAAAIARSESLNEIAKLEIDGDSGDALTAIRTLVTCEIDYAMTDREGKDLMDVWGFDEAAPAGEMLWRLAITFADSDDSDSDE